MIPSVSTERSAGPAAAPNPRPSLRQIWVIVWSYRFWISLLTFGLLGVVGVITQTSDKVYRATATLVVGFTVDDASADGGVTPEKAAAHMRTQAELVRSSRTLGRAVEQQGLMGEPAYMEGYAGDGSPESLMSWAVDHLNQKLRVHHSDNRLLHIAVEDSDPRQAARLANAVAEAFVEARIIEPAGSGTEMVEYFAAQLEGFETKVAEAQAALTAFREKNSVLALPERGDVDPLLLVELERRVSQARERRTQAERDLEAVEDEDGGGRERGVVGEIRSALERDQKELARLRDTLGARHPDIIALQRRIEDSRTRLQSESIIFEDRAKAELREAKELEERLQRELARQRERSTAARSIAGEGARLQAELQAATRVYLNAFDSYDRMREGAAGPFRDADLEARATVPREPIRPRVLRSLVIAGIAGLLLGILGALIAEFLHRRVRCREDLERGLGVPVLAELPSGV